MKEYHILSLSGGKDSTALAFFIKENIPEVHEKIEYVFCDTENEIPETYDYLDKIEIFLDKPIIRLMPKYSFDHLYQVYRILPSVNRRWCTVELKTKVFRKYIYDRLKKEGDGKIHLYIGIRADESERAKSHPNDDRYIIETHPFIENGIKKQEVMDIIINSGIGMPDYYSWRKRSGCYFCFYQSKMDWINLYENHPDLFHKASSYEHEAIPEKGKGRFGWNVDRSLKDMIKPENMQKIKENYKKLKEKRAKQASKNKSNTFFDNFDDPNEPKCLLCHI
ncbi:MAG: phosphoadenosine phosphosulfate reductase family protein [Candidatus Gastranaerophilaceae bacterium]|jgi:3'-phosphoadenosine 5'-phosphosulfate sulfotransferase (PAPS reductase)/FAD synthetase